MQTITPAGRPEKMKAEELRIGNLLVLSDTGESFTVTGMMLDSHGPKIYGQTYSGEYCSPRDNQCKPVILTEQWLLRAGFVKQINKGFVTFHNYVCMTDLYLRESFKGGYYFGFIINGRHYEFNDATNYEYVHQLQNLYFALTSEELTFAGNHNPCTSDDPDDRCEHCNCWKSTRANCS